jgi:PKD repeat protein
MKTFTFKTLLKALMLILSVGIFNASVAQCAANFTYSTGLNGHVAFTSTSTWSAGIPSYIWDPGDASTNGSGSTYNHVYKANGTYTVALTLLMDSGSTCTSTYTVALVVSNVTSPCNLVAGVSYSLGSNGAATLTSTSTSIDPNTLYYWSAGDGSPRVQGTTTYNHTYKYTGSYLAWLTIEDTGAAYCIDSTAVWLSITNADSNTCGLAANFTYSIGPNGHVTFTSTSTITSGDTNGIICHWSFGVTPDSSNNSPATNIFTANGTYNITLIATYGAYCVDSITIPVTVTNVTTPCTLSANFTEANSSTTGVATFTSTSTGTNSETQYWWNPGDGSPTVLGGTPYNYTYTANGAYTAKLIVRDTGTQYCVDSISLPIVNISNVDPLVASFTEYNISDSLGSYGYEFTSTSTGINNVTMYLWNPGDTTSADSGIGMTSYTHYYKDSGAHTATLSIWFTVYPKIKPHGTMGYTRYDFSTYSQTIDVGGKPTGIATITGGASGMSLYPTPNNGQFRLSVSNIASGNADIEIINVLGETLYKGMTQVSNGKLQQDINLNAPNGSYFVRVVTEGKVYIGRTVINNR